jgi:hypothetical protein
MSFSSLIWFVLLDDTSSGLPYMATSVDALPFPSGCDVVDFRRAVHLANAPILTKVSASQLLVYKNRAAYHKRTDPNDSDGGAPMSSAQPLDGLGASVDAPVIVVVPSAQSLHRHSTSQPYLPGKETNIARRKRWEQLNQILANKANKKTKTKD